MCAFAGFMIRKVGSLQLDFRVAVSPQQASSPKALKYAGFSFGLESLGHTTHETIYSNRSILLT